MDISEEVKALYRWQSSLDEVARAGTTACIFADALRGILAELLTTEHKLHHWQTNSLAGCSHCLTDKKAEAERLLRDTAHE